MTDPESELEEVQAAIAVLEEIARLRGVDNHWLWEVEPGAPMGFGPDDDPRQPLVQGGPDVILQASVIPMIKILEEAVFAIGVVGEGPRAPLGIPLAVELARAINREAPEQQSADNGQGA